MARGWYGETYPFTDYVSVGERRRQAVQHAKAVAKDQRRTLSPIVIDGRKITNTFWGSAWCDNLARYSDFASRLPRGRSYVRNGSVIDLQIAPGRVTALVCGSELYTVQIDVAEVPKARWDAICHDSAGAIDSVVDLLQGRLSEKVMSRLSRQGTGLFPASGEIRMSCSCPDRALMCKHIAAVLYGIGARLDHEPELLFTLRHVKAEELIARAAVGKGLTNRTAPVGRRTIDDESALGTIFGLEIAPARKAPVRKAPARKSRPRKG
jgi:uncharacterized Zn finger protein